MNREPIDRGEHRRGKREKHRLVTRNTGTTHRLSSYSSLPSCPSSLSLFPTASILFLAMQVNLSIRPFSKRDRRVAGFRSIFVRKFPFLLETVFFEEISHGNTLKG